MMNYEGIWKWRFILLGWRKLFGVHYFKNTVTKISDLHSVKMWNGGDPVADATFKEIGSIRFNFLSPMLLPLANRFDYRAYSSHWQLFHCSEYGNKQFNGLSVDQCFRRWLFQKEILIRSGWSARSYWKTGNLSCGSSRIEPQRQYQITWSDEKNKMTFNKPMQLK